MHYPRSDAQQAQNRCGDKPPRLPERRQNNHSQAGSNGIPNAVFVAGGDVKLIMSWSQAAVVSHPGRAGFRPTRFMVFQPVTKSSPFRSGKVQACKLDFELLLAGAQ